MCSRSPRFRSSRPPSYRRCAYPAVNGVPCCADAYFMTQLMKDTWGMGSSHGGGSYVQGDCGAIENIASAHHYAVNTTFAAALALDAGADVDCGNGFPGQLGLALELGLTTEQELDASLTRTYTLQMLAGRFDPPAAQPYMSIPFEAIKSPAHTALSFESGLQGMVLLRNEGGLLPLSASAKLAFIGPAAGECAPERAAAHARSQTRTPGTCSIANAHSRAPYAYPHRASRLPALSPHRQRRNDGVQLRR